MSSICDSSVSEDLPEADRAQQNVSSNFSSLSFKISVRYEKLFQVIEEELESMSSQNLSPSSSIMDFRGGVHETARYSQSLTGSLERRLRRRTSQSSNSDHSSSSSLSRRSK